MRSYFSFDFVSSLFISEQFTRSNQTQMKITLVDSPINQISSDKTTTQPLTEDPKNPVKFAAISKRLGENIKKLEQNELKDNNLKRINNFKLIKNSIINKSAQVRRNDIINSLKEKQQEDGKNQNEAKFQNMNYEVTENCSYNSISKKLFEEDPPKHLQNAVQNRYDLAKDVDSLSNCLKQIKEVKQTIKNLKERCKHGHQEQRSKQSSIQQNIKQTRKEYLSHSGQRYNYTNYHNLSQKKLNELSQRKQRSQKSFNWIRNPVAVKEFTICTAQQEANIQID